MSKVVRFRKLKHGDPPRFKVLPEDLGGQAPAMAAGVRRARFQSWCWP